jgi:HEAT repeat protein
MGKKQCMMLTGLFVAVLTGFVWLNLFQNQSEPVYQGKPLGFWLKGYSGYTSITNGPSSEQADEAVRQIGTNAIPLLLRMLRAKDSSFRIWVIDLLYWQRLIRVHFSTDWDGNYQAFRGFVALGAAASNAVPAMGEILDLGVSSGSQSLTADALASLGPTARKAVPSLLRASASTNESVRGQAVLAPGRIHAEPEMVVPALVRSLNDSTFNVRHAAVIGLGGFGPRAKPAVPALVGLIEKKDIELNEPAINTLKQIDPEGAKSAVPVLIELLEHDHDLKVRRQAATALRQIGSAAVDAIPTFVRHATNDPDYVVSFTLLQALGDLHQRPELVVPALTDGLESRPDLYEPNAMVLGKFGMDAQPAFPYLARFLEYTNKNPSFQAHMRAIATNALKQIDPETAAKAGVK